MSAPAGDEEQGTWEAQDVFPAGRPGQPFHHSAPAGGGREGQPTIRSRRPSSGNFVAQASRLQQGRKRSMRAFQSDIANERSFTHALAGVELEDVRPNTAQIEPRLQLPWPFLLRLKVNTFAVPLGLSSQAQLWGTLSHSSLVTSALGSAIPSVVQWIFWVLALGLLIVVALGYLCKATLYWGAVKREWAHPIRSNFVFTPFLASLTLVGGVPRPISRALHPSTAVPLPAFMFLTALVVYLEMASYGKWLFNQTRSLSRANPSYQLAVVGNFLVARLGTQVSGGRNIEIACGEISLFFFAVGILYLTLVFFAIQQHSADNIMQPSSATSAGTETFTPPRAAADAISKGGGGNGGGGGGGGGGGPCAAGDSRRQQRPREGHQYHGHKGVSAAVVSGWGNRPPVRPARIEEGEDDGSVPVAATASSGINILSAGNEEVESKDDITTARYVGRSGGGNVAARSPSFPESWKKPASSPSQQHCLYSGVVRQDEASGTTRVPVDGEVLERVLEEGATTAPAAPAPAVEAPIQAQTRAVTTGAVGERMVLSRALHPIYFLFVAPPSAASIAWTGIAGEFDMLAKSLYFIAGFLYMFFVLGNSSFLRTESFSIAWWAYSFPSSTFAVATIMYAEGLSSEGVVLVGFALALASTLLVLVVFALTVSSALTGTLFVDGFAPPSSFRVVGPADVGSRGSGSAPLAVSTQTEEELREKLAQNNEDLSEVDSKVLKNFGGVDDAQFLTEIKKERPYFAVLAEKASETVDSILQSRPSKGDVAPDTGVAKPRIVVLGTGWAAHSLLKEIDASKFEVTTVSPRNFFLFTPMLAASAVGTVEYRSITEPIRKVNAEANYLEATCTGIDVDRKTITCENVVCEGTTCNIEDFELPYDYLVVSVGATTNTFNTPGVREHCIFLKQVQDAQKLRKAIGNCFERANLPTVTEEQRIAALTFAVVGAGPTGVECCAELRDFIEEEGPRFYPHLLKYVRIKLIEASDKVLSVFDGALQKAAVSSLTERTTTLIEQGLIETEMTEVMLKVGVKAVTGTQLELSDGSSVPYGLAVWAAGNGPLPLVLDLIEGVQEQKEKAAWGRGRLVTDDWLRVLGAPSVFALGDCSVVEDKPLPQTAQVASQQGAYLARLFSRGFEFSASVPQKSGSSDEEGEAPGVTPDDGTPDPEGKDGKVPLSEKLGLSVVQGKFAKPFQFLNLGILAYTGAGGALAQVQVGKESVKTTGATGYLLWRSIYLSKQVSWRNRLLVGTDWLKTRIFGRDITRL
eukprot:g7023.t1